jgi:hypothetical protein
MLIFRSNKDGFVLFVYIYIIFTLKAKLVYFEWHCGTVVKVEEWALFFFEGVMYVFS